MSPEERAAQQGNRALAVRLALVAQKVNWRTSAILLAGEVLMARVGQPEGPAVLATLVRQEEFTSEA